MKVGDVVQIHTFGPMSEVRQPCFALVFNADLDSKDAHLVIVAGAYMVPSGHWCEVGHTFALPYAGPGKLSQWAVLPPDEIPDGIYTELAKLKLLGEK